MKVLDPGEGSDQSDDENGSPDKKNLGEMLFSNDTDLRRSFTVRNYNETHSDLLAINKHDLYRMKIEFRDSFA